tara:strand:+ start:572 stop:748 length:177 start_codon:yes stop_codon:yes gene_type:complete
VVRASSKKGLTMTKKDYIYIGIIIILIVALVIQFKHKESCEEICWKMIKEMSESPSEI